MMPPGPGLNCKLERVWWGIKFVKPRCRQSLVPGRWGFTRQERKPPWDFLVIYGIATWSIIPDSAWELPPLASRTIPYPRVTWSVLVLLLFFVFCLHSLGLGSGDSLGFSGGLIFFILSLVFVLWGLFVRDTVRLVCFVVRGVVGSGGLRLLGGRLDIFRCRFALLRGRCCVRNSRLAVMEWGAKGNSRTGGAWWLITWLLRFLFLGLWSFFFVFLVIYIWNILFGVFVPAEVKAVSTCDCGLPVKWMPGQDLDAIWDVGVQVTCDNASIAPLIRWLIVCSDSVQGKKVRCNDVKGLLFLFLTAILWEGLQLFLFIVRLLSAFPWADHEVCVGKECRGRGGGRVEEGRGWGGRNVRLGLWGVFWGKCGSWAPKLQITCKVPRLVNRPKESAEILAHRSWHYSPFWLIRLFFWNPLLVGCTISETWSKMLSHAKWQHGVRHYLFLASASVPIQVWRCVRAAVDKIQETLAVLSVTQNGAW